MEFSSDINALWDESIRLHGLCRYEDALDRLYRLEATLPDHARLLANMGMVYRDNGDLVNAERYLRKASLLLPDDPAVHFNLALTLMRAGRLREGFDEYEWRWQIPQFQEQHRRFSQPLWSGE